MINLDIVIVNWNTGFQLKECLQSIILAAQSPTFHLRKCIVVDNASTDNSTDHLKGNSLTITLIRNPENMGFAYACNQGAQAGDSGYILFLNPDTILFPDSLEKPLRFLEEGRISQVGILGIQLVNQDGIIQRNAARFPTIRSIFYQMLGFDRLWPSRFPSHFMTDWDHRQNREVDQVTGAFFMIQRKLFDQLGGFDERFFMYYEDLDFSYRARLSGWKSYFLADARAIHHGGGASSQVKTKRLYYVMVSRVLYIAKFFGVVPAYRILAASFLVEFWARLGWCLFDSHGRNFLEIIQAYWMLLKSLPHLNTSLHIE
jgi:N-acetylglucosaminyl-diphospho-decaprenol L-rhamnosyltransferase